MMKVYLVLALIALSGCSTMQPPRYSISVDNVEALNKYEDAQLTVSQFSQSVEFNSSCRLMGPIEPADRLTFPDFIGKAFNDELKMAGVHSDVGTKISGDITNVDFSSTKGITNGFWDISIFLTSSNGKTLATPNRYTFKSGFDAITACNATAGALTPAVQDLIQKTVTNPEFVKLL